MPAPVVRRIGILASLAVLVSPGVAAEAGRIPDHVVIVLAEGVEIPHTRSSRSTTTGEPALDAALAEVGALSLRPFILDGGVSQRDPELFRALGLDRHFVVEIARGADVPSCLSALRRCPTVARARPQVRGRSTAVPNDTHFADQWHLRQPNDADIDAHLAWNMTTGSPFTAVAVLDGGVDLNHPDLQANLVWGYDFVDSDFVPDDTTGHGTWCAGVVGAIGNNGVGVAGVAWKCSLIPVRVTTGNMTDASLLASGIVFAADRGAEVISMSLRTNAPDEGLEAALDYAVGLDSLCISGTENIGGDGFYWPASYSTCMAIGATTQCDERVVEGACGGGFYSFESTYGQGIDLVAPGVVIWTTQNGGGYSSSFEGVSASVPMVAGAAALVRSLDPLRSWSQVRDILRSTAEDQVGDPAEDTPGYDKYYGYGRLNVRKALEVVGPWLSATVSIDDLGVPGSGSSAGADPALSADGRYAVFASEAALVAGDANSLHDVYLHDSESETTERISSGLLGVDTDGASTAPDVSADARFVAFASSASNIVSGDTNGFEDVFVHDRSLGTTTLLSTGLSGLPANGPSTSPCVSADGRFVAFASSAANLVLFDPNGVSDVFLVDRDADGNGIFDELGGVSVALVSADAAGGPGNAASGVLGGPALSADGRHVAFASFATNLAPAVTNTTADVYAFDATTGSVARVSRGPTGAQPNADCASPAISADGRCVVFHSAATNLVPISSPCEDVYLVDRDTDADGVFDEPGATALSLVSQSSSGAPGNSCSRDGDLCDAGRYVVFSSDATDLVPGDTNAARDVFLRDRSLGTTELVSATAAGDQGNAASAASSRPSISASGRVSVFESASTNLDPVDGNGTVDVFVRNNFTTNLCFSSHCSCDAPITPPPCGTVGAPGVGCVNSSGFGALLAPSGTGSVLRDDLVLTATRLPADALGLVLISPLLKGPTGGIVFGDGLRCIGGSGAGIVYLHQQSSGSSGTLALGPGIVSTSRASAAGEITPGTTWHFQTYYVDRDAPCGWAANLSNAVSVTFSP